ncbi:cytochrome P450 [Amylostereum chailletii]|nr:cytochrome P450 [Amylostereum chailletii]
MLTQAASAALVIVVSLLIKPLFSILRQIIHPYFSPLRDVTTVPGSSFLWGHRTKPFGSDPLVMHEQNVEKYGRIVKYKDVFNSDRLFVCDTRAIAHILNNTGTYTKGDAIRFNLKKSLGPGVLFVEGDEHRKQRRVMSPAFGLPHLRILTPIFVDKANQLRDIWKERILAPEGEKQSKGLIDASKWLSKLTLDIIGLAGFKYSFDALNPADTPNELYAAVRLMLTAPRPSLIEALRFFVPVFRIFPSKRSRIVAKGRITMDAVGRRLLGDMKAAVVSEHDGKDKIERSDFQQKDILSLLVKANMATDLPENSRLSDEDVLAQVPTFLIAGHETTSTSTAWILFVLSKYPEVQDKLRAELLACPDGDAPSMETLNAFPYMDAVVREVLRLYCPLPSIVRVAEEDDFIPTEHEWTDRHGVKRSGIPISKGDGIFVPVMAINRLKEIWGPDAREFKPERWENPPKEVSSVPGIWGNNLVFSSGPRACIGYRFSLVETKAILYALVRAFKFSLACGPDDIVIVERGIMRPALAKEIEKGVQLPLWISPVDEL